MALVDNKSPNVSIGSMASQDSIGTRQKPRLLDRVRNTCRVRHLSTRTEKSYVHWIRRFIIYHGKRHPRELDADHVREFLTYLATDLHVASSTQNQALCAVVLLFRHVIGKDVGDFSSFQRARRPKRLPVVLTRDEVSKVLAELTGTNKLVAQLLYGAGLRLSEALRIRVKDIDLHSRQIIVRAGKGDRDRITVLPAKAQNALRMHLEVIRGMHNRDLAEGFGETALPDALARKYPGAARSWAWQYVFPSETLSRDDKSGRLCRHHRSPATVQRAVKDAVQRTGIVKRASCHTLRHSFATHLIQAGYDIRTVQELLGHKNVKTTMVYTHVLNSGGVTVRSPLDVE